MDSNITINPGVVQVDRASSTHVLNHVGYHFDAIAGDHNFTGSGGKATVRDADLDTLTLGGDEQTLGTPEENADLIADYLYANPGTSGGAPGNYDPPIPQSDVTGLVTALSPLVAATYIIDTGSTNTAQDPGQNTLRINHASLASATELSMSDIDGMAVDQSTLASLLGGVLVMRTLSSGATCAVLINDAVHTSFTRFTITHLKGTWPADGAVVAVGFLPSNTWDPLTHTREQHDGLSLDSHEFAVYDVLEGRSERATGDDLLNWIREDIADMFSALGTVAAARTGSAIAFDVPAEYNTAASPSSGSVTADYTGSVAGTQVLCWFNHGAEPAWPAGWTITGAWDAGAKNAVVLTYRTGTTVSGFIVSDAAGTPSNPENIYYLTGDWSIGTNGTPTQLTGFSGIPILAGKLYAVDMVLRGTCSGTGGLRLGFWANTGTDHLLRMAGRTDFAADAGVYFVHGANQGYNSLQTSYAFFAATLANNFCRMSGTIRGGAVDGVFELRGSSVTASQTSTVYADGSYVRVTRMN